MTSKHPSLWRWPGSVGWGSLCDFTSLNLTEVYDKIWLILFLIVQIASSASIDLQDYTYYFVAAPWLSVKLLRLLQCYPPPGMVQYSAVTLMEKLLSSVETYRPVTLQVNSTLWLWNGQRRNLVSFYVFHVKYYLLYIYVFQYLFLTEKNV